MKKFTTLLVGLLSAVLIFTGCNSDKPASTAEKTDLEAIKEKGEIVVGLDDTFAPLGFRDDNGDLVGFDIDLAKKLGEKLGVNVKLQPIDWSMKEAELNNKNIDLIWNGYTITDKRKEQVNFTKPYLKNSQVILVLADSDIKSKADLKGKTVSVQKESSALEAVNAEPEVVAGFKGKEAVQFDTNIECILDLEAKRTDAVVADEVLVRYVMKQRGAEKYKLLEDNFGEEEYGIGVRKEDTNLLAEVDRLLDECRSDGSFQEISDKWLA